MSPKMKPARQTGSVALWVVDGIRMTVEKKKIKNMYIRLDASGGPVRITAPLAASEERIRFFVDQRMDWIRRKQKALRDRPVAAYEEGEIHFLWGRPFPLALRTHPISQGRRARCSVDEDRILLEIPEGLGISGKAALLDALYRREMNAAVPSALDKAERITGKRASAWKVRKMSSRWGSCNVIKASVSLNLRLAQKPLYCLEYVAIHELTHLLEKGHGPRFWSYMDQFCPDWKAIRKVLAEKRGHM